MESYFSNRHLAHAKQTWKQRGWEVRALRGSEECLEQEPNSEANFSCWAGRWWGGTREEPRWPDPISLPGQWLMKALKKIIQEWEILKSEAGRNTGTAKDPSNCSPIKHPILHMVKQGWRCLPQAVWACLGLGNGQEHLVWETGWLGVGLRKWAWNGIT